MSETLKPCPFCGHEGIAESSSMGSATAYCSNSECDLGPETAYCTNMNKAIAIWNQRVDPQHQALVDVLKAVVDCLGPDKDDGYRAEDPEGAMDTAFAQARKVLHDAGEQP